jgi:glutathione-regulated potassium-efflux system ancillary protein KefG
MPRVLILFAHPRLENSKINRSMIEHIPHNSLITFHDLYEIYPDFNVNIEKEKKLLEANDIIVWHHPFYWYSAPPLLKQWIDMVLELGWAYGPGGNALSGKWIFNAITTGGAKEAYSREGHNRFYIYEFLAMFNQTAHLCKMIYLPPFVIQGTHRLSDEENLDSSRNYGKLLTGLSEGKWELDRLKTLTSLNEAVDI